MESAALEATPAGCLFADWIQRRGVSKSTAYQWRAALGIKAEKRRVGTRVEVWLTAADEALLEDYGEALGRGLPVADALAAVRDGRINNAASIIALQWLALNRDEVRGMWS